MGSDGGAAGASEGGAESGVAGSAGDAGSAARAESGAAGVTTSTDQSGAGGEAGVRAEGGSDSAGAAGGNAAGGNAAGGSAGGGSAGGGSAGGSTGGGGGLGGSAGAAPGGGLIVDPTPCGPQTLTAGQLLDFGHSGGFTVLRRSGNRILSRDGGGGPSALPAHWVLWDVANRGQVLSGDSPSVQRPPDNMGFLELQGNTLAVETVAGTIELRSTDTGSLLTTVTSDATAFGLASDGSYLWGSSSTGIKAWSTSGTVLANRAGAYAASKIYAAPGELRVAQGPAGLYVIELIDVSTGSATTSPAFTGGFSSWFLDGAHFITSVGSTVWIYPKSGVGAKGPFAVVGGTAVGQGAFFWTAGPDPSSPLPRYAFVVYSAADGSTVLTTAGASSPIDVVNPSTASSGPLFTTYSTTVRGQGPYHFHIVRFDASPPVDTDYGALPDLPENAVPGLFAADALGNWSITFNTVYNGDSLGASGKLTQFGCAVQEVVASPSGTVAIAANNGIIIGHVGAQGNSIVGRIPFAGYHLQISASGDTLAAMPQGEGDPIGLSAGHVHVFSLPDGIDRHTFENVSAFSIASGGTRIVVVGSGQARVLSLDGTQQDLSVPVNGMATNFLGMPNTPLSPDGTLFAVPDGDYTSFVATRIYKNGVLVTAVPGAPIQWLDDSRLLARAFTRAVAEYQYTTAMIYDSTGELISPALPLSEGYFPFYRTTFSLVDSTHLLMATNGDICDTGTGAVVWTAAPLLAWAGLAANLVVGLNGHRVLVEAH
ncbi:MAG: hypothetical protein ABI488_10425 [Polyangiaceae bacterium]